MSTQDLLETTTPVLAPTAAPGPAAAARRSADVAAWVRKAIRAATEAHAHRGAICLVDQAVVSGTNFLTTVILGRVCFQ